MTQLSDIYMKMERSHLQGSWVLGRAAVQCCRTMVVVHVGDISVARFRSRTEMVQWL